MRISEAPFAALLADSRLAGPVLAGPVLGNAAAAQLPVTFSDWNRIRGMHVMGNAELLGDFARKTRLNGTTNPMTTGGYVTDVLGPPPRILIPV